MISLKPTIAVFFPVFLGGGAESVCAWMLQALKDKYRLRLVTFSPVDCAGLNRLYDTRLASDDVELVVPHLRRWLPNKIVYGNSFFTLRQHLLICCLKALKETHDLVISAFNEIDAGRRAIQYVHFPMVAPGHEAARRLVGYPDSTARRMLRGLCQRASRFSNLRMLDNLTLANSRWTARVIKQMYDLDVTVVYPPVVPGSADTEWRDREEGFVLVSRIVPDKKIERAIRILSGVRARGYNIHLHVIGRGDERHRRYLQGLAGESSWIFWEGQVDRDKFNELLRTHRYGIHVRENEHFGIGVAEMLRAGCLPFVPASGGPVEIVGDNRGLTFDDEQEAMEKIVRVLSSSERQRELLDRLTERKALFSTERFEAEMRGVVDQFMGVPT
jgi:glycosyltransferase involved in cell wall biosynthesis